MPMARPTTKFINNKNKEKTEMGFMWINKNVKVNCEKNYKDDKRLTLVDNKYGEVHDFSLSTDVLKYLLEKGFTGVENYIDELVAEKFNKEQEDRKWREFAFFVKKSDAPYIINKLDASDNVKQWEVRDDTVFKDDGMVRIDYTATKQILIQTPDGVVIDD
jgi:hypothetical protein